MQVLRHLLAFVFVYLALLAPADATVTRVGTGNGTNTCTTITHAIGDLLVVAAFRATTGTPSLPAGFLTPTNGTKTGTSSSMRMGFKIATATNDSFGTWTNATATVCHVYRAGSYATGGSLFIGAVANNSSTTNTINFPALTLIHGDTTSWVLGFVGANNLTNTIAANPPSGMTNESSETSATDQAAGHDTNGAVASWSSTNATTTGTPGGSVSMTVELIENQPGTAISNYLVQHVSYGYNPGPGLNNDAANKVAYILPNATLANNILVLAVANQTSRTVSITDDKGNSWPGSPNQVVTGANMNLSIFVLASVTTGTQTITVSMGSAVSQPLKVWITELRNVTGAANGATAPGVNSNGIVSPGSFTPTANNANGGNLVLSYMADSATTGTTNPALIVPETRYSLNDADISWTQGQGNPNASQFYLQATSAATTPQFYLNAGGSDTYNVAAIALAVGVQGTAKAAGIHIDRICYFATANNIASMLVQIPSTGNLGFLQTFSGNAPPTITAILDQPDAANWTNINPTSGAPAPWYRANYTPNSSRTANLSLSSTGNPIQLIFYDISGAATSPLDTSASAAVAATSTNNLTSLANFPSSTPSGANELVLAFFVNSQGSTFAVTTPSAAILDGPSYQTSQFTATIATTVLNVTAVAWGTVLVGASVTGAGVTPGTTIISQGTGTGGTGTYNLSISNTVAVGETMTGSGTDSGTLIFGNMPAHYYNGSDTTTENWAWTFTEWASNSASATVVAFKAAPPSSGGASMRSLMGVGQ